MHVAFFVSLHNVLYNFRDMLEGALTTYTFFVINVDSQTMVRGSDTLIRLNGVR